MPYKDHLTGYSNHFMDVRVEDGVVSYEVVEKSRNYPITAVKRGEPGRTSRALTDSPSVRILADQLKLGDQYIQAAFSNQMDESRTYYLSWENIPEGMKFIPSQMELIMPARSECLFFFL